MQASGATSAGTASYAWHALASTPAWGWRQPLVSATGTVSFLFWIVRTLAFSGG